MARLKRRMATSNGSFSLTRIPGIAVYLERGFWTKEPRIIPAFRALSKRVSRHRIPGSGPKARNPAAGPMPHAKMAVPLDFGVGKGASQGQKPNRGRYVLVEHGGGGRGA